MREDVFYMPHRYDLIDLKAAVIKASEHFGLGEHTFAPFVDVIVETTREHQARHDTFAEEIQGISKPTEHRRITAQELLLHVFLRTIATYITPVVRQFLVDDAETAVDAFGIVEQSQIHDRVVLEIRYLQEGKAVSVAYRFRLTTVETRLVEQHLVVFFSSDGQHRLMNRVQRSRRTGFICPRHLCILALLDLHRRDGHIGRVLPVMLHEHDDSLYRTDNEDRPHRYFRREVIRQLGQNPPTQTDQNTGIGDQGKQRLPEPGAFIRAVHLHDQSDHYPQHG